MSLSLQKYSVFTVINLVLNVGFGSDRNSITEPWAVYTWFPPAFQGTLKYSPRAILR
jgi:hypothetical protein